MRSPFRALPASTTTGFRRLLAAAALLAASTASALPIDAEPPSAEAASTEDPIAVSAPTTRISTPGGFERTESREPCAEFDADRRPLFGDLHVHTARSQDASTQDTRVTPRDAYRFARGESLGIQPFSVDGRPLRRVKLARPLDFAAVTDHSEQLGEVHICQTPDFEGYGSIPCRLYRSFPRVAFFLFNGRYSMIGSRWGFCGEDFENCYAAAGIVWNEHRSAAEEAYDRSAACEFTSLVAYEWTAAPGGGHLHRNVIFRNANVPDLPVSAMETGPHAVKLWRLLDAACVEGVPGCEVLTIPHNSNWSLESAFTSGETLYEPISAEEAPLRARFDRLVEMIQHKGESECSLFPGVNDEGCAFEKAPNPYQVTSDGEPAEIDFARGALKQGLLYEAELGENPLAFGQIGSTDTHLGTPGLVAERGHPGHGGAGKPGNTVFDGPGLPDQATMNPGGLAAVWAEENSRDAIYAAMDRRETYATSGTRPSLRLFGGWAFASSICQAEDLAAQGYAAGVPMGGVLPERPAEATAPRFVVAASRDPHPNGGDLERIEIVKGWVEDGEAREGVLTIAGGDMTPDVDLTTCEPTGPAHDTLCTVWTDPDFDPEQSAFYYARLREAPSCRWTQWACIDQEIACDGTRPSREGFEYCCNPENADFPATIQERAWSSPIWYQPTGATSTATTTPTTTTSTSTEQVSSASVVPSGTP